MRDVATKIDGSTTLPADVFNSYLGELENTVTQTGQTLDPDAGPDTDLTMIGKAMSVYGSGGGDFYTDSGAVNAYVLSKVGSVVANPGYFNGMRCLFKVGNTNTGASTVNASALGSANITLQGGTALSGGELIAGQLVELIYSTTGTRFELVILSSNINKITLFTSSGTWTKPAGLKSVKATVVGGGGAGGGAATNNGTAAAGGSGAGTAIKIILAADLAATETITIGAGGPGGLNTGGDGDDGGTSSFGSHFSATGGLGGDGGTTVTARDGQTGGATGGTPDIAVKGNGSGGVGGVSGELGGFGGGSSLGGGAPSVQESGVNGGNYGGGGGGANRVTINVGGGDGADGIIIVEEFF